MRDCYSSLLLLATLSLPAMCGCGADANKGVVSGQVTFAGKPVSDGLIRFQSQAGVSENIDLDAEGKYQVKNYEGVGLPPGEYQVAVLPRIVAATNSPPLAGATPPEDSTKEFPHIPPKFRDISTSKLTIKVERGTNPPFDFDLSK
ncbi:MAG: hypothetical protein ACKV2Q_32085 [Planctomycetaceae bacterium]